MANMKTQRSAGTTKASYRLRGLGTVQIANTDSATATILDADDPDDRRVLDRLRAGLRIEFVDRWREPASVQRLRPPFEPDLLAEPVHVPRLSHAAPATVRNRRRGRHHMPCRTN
jgi:hypothetical protein